MLSNGLQLEYKIIRSAENKKYNVLEINIKYAII